MSLFKIFLVEDDSWYGELMKYHLSLNPDYEVSLFTSANACLDNLNKKPNLICMDLGLPDISGETLLSRIRAHNKSMPVIVISGQKEISIALRLLKSGISDYIIKDANAKDLLWNAIIRVRENLSLKEEVEVLKDRLHEKFSFEKILIGQSNAIRGIYSVIEKASKTSINVSITGETGTGKEVVAKSIHFNSDRRKNQLVTVNVSAIPKELLESELFGHEKGAFTGAIAKRVGKFEEANGGTIFLDEIAELDLNFQAKLLRVLQEREIVRIGSNKPIKLDVRLITATHRNMSQLVKDRKFREDLFYRIMGIPIAIPPLRERGNDILILAKHFAKEYALSNKVVEPILSEQSKTKLMQYNFPGNVRELKAIIDLACVMCEGDEIKGSDISYPATFTEQRFTTIEKTMEEYTWDIVLFYLKKYNQNVVTVARKLDIGKSTIYNLLKKNETNVQPKLN